MTFSPHDALLHGPGVRTHLEHLQIVIGFEHQQIGAAQVEFYGIRHIAEVGDDADLDALRTETEADRIDGVVRDGEAVDVDISDRKRSPGLETVQLGSVLAPGNGGAGQGRGGYREAYVLCEPYHSTRAVRLVV